MLEARRLHAAWPAPGEHPDRFDRVIDQGDDRLKLVATCATASALSAAGSVGMPSSLAIYLDYSVELKPIMHACPLAAQCPPRSRVSRSRTASHTCWL
jgi:hypothetical protein